MDKTYKLKNINEPEKVVEELDKYIVGQNEAKKSVAISLRNRYRRKNINSSMSEHIIPKNILMIGPTGVGKTEIARRLSIIYDAPFIKVEATRFTEVGYVGKDVETIIKDLVELSIKLEKEKEKKKNAKIVKDKVENVIIKKLIKIQNLNNVDDKLNSYNLIKNKLDSGFFDKEEIEIEIPKKNIGLEIMNPLGTEEITKHIQGFFNNISNEKKIKKKLTVKSAITLMEQEENNKLINEEELQLIVKKKIEDYGIIFIDEIDKITQSSQINNSRGEVSREGVQRDLLPLIEGSNVKTKIGIIKTDNILFIASGSFYSSKPSDLLPELQGRLPVKIFLKSLAEKDFMRILVEPKSSIIKQHQALLETEGINLKYEKKAIKSIAKISCDINKKTEDLGVRRLYSIMEYLLEDISFNSNKLRNRTIKITESYVKKKLKYLVKYQNLDEFIL